MSKCKCGNWCAEESDIIVSNTKAETVALIAAKLLVARGHTNGCMWPEENYITAIEQAKFLLDKASAAVTKESK